jgi:hypothetical protein
MMEYSKVGDMAYVEFSPIDIYSHFSEWHYEGIYSVRNIVMCNYLYL